MKAPRAGLAGLAALSFAVLASRGVRGQPDEEPDPPDLPDPELAPAPSATATPPLPDRGMVRIAGATFRMGGDDAHAPPNERPAHDVTVHAFLIDRTEVTVGDARACVERGACAALRGHSSRCDVRAGDPDAALNCVPWTWADAFCRTAGKRLPTEAEWELVASGARGLRYPWGPQRASCALAVTMKRDVSAESCSSAGPARVGSRPRGASAAGVLDLAGNVEEWVADWYGDRYPDQGAVVDPKGPGWGVAHVLRGGGWLSPPRDARTSARSWGSLAEAGPNVGFRCAKDDR